MFERVSLPDISRVGRRTMISTLIVAVVAVGASLALNLPLVALGACIGLGLGVLNFRMITASVIRVGKMPGDNKRRPLAMNTFTRLAFISVVTLGLLFVNFGLGFGVLGGLAVFQMLLLANVARAMFHQGYSGPSDPANPGSPAGEHVVDTTAYPRGEG